MHLRRHWRSLSFMLALLVAGAAVRPAAAAAPRLLMIYGGPLAKPVILDNWAENGSVFGDEMPTIKPADLEGRPYLKLALFGGPRWRDYVDAGKPLDALRPEDANQHGRFYPPFGGAAPLITLDSIPGPGWPVRRVEPRGIAMLVRHDIPMRWELPVETGEWPDPPRFVSPGPVRTSSDSRRFMLPSLIALALLALGGLYIRRRA